MDTSPEIVVLNKNKALADYLLKFLRSVNEQKDPMKFRGVMRVMGTIAGWEISRFIEWRGIEVDTPLGKAQCQEPVKKPVIIGILRAGLPLMEGMQSAFPDSPCGFIASYRKYRDEEHSSFVSETSYVAIPDVNDAPVIVCDPMIATGSCLADAIHSIKERGKPSSIIVCGVIATQYGVEKLTLKHPDIRAIIVFAMDPEINDRGYIVPGLGDAGDLAFGIKKDY